MTQENGLPDHDDASSPQVAAPPPEPIVLPPSQQKRGGVGWAVLYILTVALLAGAGYWAWQHPVAPAAETANPALDALAARVAALEAKPAPIAAPVDLKPLQDRLAALEHRSAPAASAAPAGLDDLTARVAKLEQAAPADSAAKPDSAAEAAVVALSGRVAALDAKLAGLGKPDSQLAGLSEQISRQARLQAAKSSLDSGLPLGPLDGAPPALARFAQDKPPTEAALKLAFPEAARAAEQAPEPGGTEAGMFGRVLARAEGLVTVRQGDRVILGNAAAGLIEQARAQLDAGDLAGAVAALDKLPGTPAPALAAWLAQAKSLLAARQALTAMMAAH
jgi:hypothetical protein